MQFLVCGRGHVRAPQVRDHLVGVWVPRARWGAKSKVEGFFAGAKSLGAAFQPDPLCATQTVTCLEWPHISPTLLQKQLRDNPSIQGVKGRFVQGGLCPFSVIAHYPAGKCCQILGGSPWPGWWWDLDVLFGGCCPTLSLSGPGKAESVAPQGGETQGQRGGPSEGWKQALLTLYLWQGLWDRDAISLWGVGQCAPMLSQKDDCLLLRLSHLLGGEV